MDPSLSRAQLKTAAVFTMALNHFAAVFLPEDSLVFALLTGIGYFTAPVMCFLLAEGLLLTRSLKRYLLRLFLCALVSQLPFDLAFTKCAVLSFVRLNMLFTLGMSLLLLAVHARPFSEPVKWGLSLLIILATIPADWGILAPVYTLMFYYTLAGSRSSADSAPSLRFSGAASSRLREVWALVVLSFALTLRNFSPLFLTGPVLAAVCVLCFYRGAETQKKERPGALSKWFFYLFYPLHLLLLGILRLCLSFPGGIH